MSKFKVGDRVACYGWNGRTTGAIATEITGQGLYRVDFDDGHSSFKHEKQLRKIVKRERKVLWIKLKEGQVWGGTSLNQILDGCRIPEPENKEGWVNLVEDGKEEN